VEVKFNPTTDDYAGAPEADFEHDVKTHIGEYLDESAEEGTLVSIADFGTYLYETHKDAPSAAVSFTTGVPTP
jgi:hypothetical protein